MSYTLESLLNTTEGMEAIRSNSKNDQGTDSVAGVDWFTYNGVVVSTIYINGNNWIGFGTPAQHLKICNRDGAIYYVYRQEGTLDAGIKFLKIRIEGYTAYRYTDDQYKLIYEVFLFEDDCLFINVIQTPTNSSYIGSSSINSGSNTVTLNINTGVTADATTEIMILNAGGNQSVAYRRYAPPSNISLSVTKTSYYQNEMFDEDTLTVLCEDTDGNTRPVTTYTLSGFDSGTSGTKTITVSYVNFTDSFDIEVLEEAIVGIEITKLPDQVEYVRKKVLNTDGMEVSYILSGGARAQITKYTVGEFDSSISGVKEITVSYGSFTTTFEVTVLAPTSIEISSLPSKLIYIKGEELDTSGMTILEVYDSGYKQTNTDYTVSEIDQSEYGEKIITVMYQELSVDFTVTLQRYVSAEIGLQTLSDVIATLDGENGILTVSGTGDIKDMSSKGGSNYPLSELLYSYRLSVKKIVVESGITSIGKWCFSGMENVTEVTLPEGITKIGDHAFTGMKMTRMEFPESVETYSSTVLYSCPLLEYVKIGGPCAPSLTGGLLGFSQVLKEAYIVGCASVKGSDIFQSGAALESITFGPYVKEFASGAFSGWSRIKHVTIQAPIAISSNCFASCTSLNDVTITGEVKEICESAFSNCTSLSQVTFPNSLETIGKNAFCKTALTSIDFEEGLKAIGVTCFSDCQNLKTVTLPESVESIGQNAFSYTFPDDMTFGGHNLEISSSMSISAKNLYIRKGTLASYAFNGRNIETLHLGGSVNLSGNNHFNSCQYLKSVVIDEGIEEIPDQEFILCTALESIELPEGLLSIGKNAFYNCSKLTSISFPSTLQSIGDYAFLYCSLLTDAEIPDSITILGMQCFQNCGFSQFVIPDACQVEALSRTFLNCANLTEVYIGKNVKTITDGTFSGIGGSPTITINNKENAISGSPWAASGATVIWLVQPVGIRVVNPGKTEYEPGESLDTTGLEVAQMYNDDSEETVTDYEVSEFDINAYGVQTITVTYNGFTADYQVVALGNTVGIKISKYPDKKYYTPGEEIDATGLIVVRVTESGTEKEITDYTLSSLEGAELGAVEVTAAYQLDTGETYTASYQAFMTEDGEDPFEKDTINGKITIHWPNGEFEDITGDEIEGGTVTLQEALCNDRYFIFGGCSCNQLSFTTGSKQFMGTDVMLDDTKIEAFFEADGTKVKLFTGKIASAKRDSGLIRRKIIAYDEMYWHRNTDISWWYRNNTVDKQTAFTQKMFRDKLFEFLGIEQVETTLYYDDAFVPNTNIPSEMNAVNIIKDMCLQNSVFGWMNRDGKFEYIKLQENGRVSGIDNAGRQHYGYYESEYKFDNFRSCEFKEGRIWYPNEFYTDPNPRIGFISGPPATAQEAYDKNTYYNRNSFFCGDAEWFDNVYLGDEYRDPTLQEPIIPICFGPVTTYDNQHLYLAQEYKMVPVHGNPMIKIGSSIEVEVKKTAEDGTELTWYVHSYIMSRTLKIQGSNSISDEYTANNAPYNSNNRQEGTDTTPINTLQTESPTISYEDFTSDAGNEGGFEAFSADETVKKAKLRCVKRIEKSDYDALVESGNQRDDTLYLTWEE